MDITQTKQKQSLTESLPSPTLSILDFYNGSLRNQSQITSANGEISFGGAHFSGRVETERASLTCLNGQAENIAAAVEFQLDNWNPECYLLLPGAVYNGNRFQLDAQNYPPQATWRDGRRCQTITDIPRLEQEGPSLLEQTSADCAIPLVAVWNPRTKQGEFVYTLAQENGQRIGYILKENDAHDAMTLQLTWPACRTKEQRICKKCPSEDSGVSMHGGDCISISYRHRIVPLASLEEFFNYVTEHRREMAPVDELRNDIPLAAAAHLVEQKFNTWNWREQYGYYTVGTQYDESVDQNWQLGWVGGGIVTEAFLKSDDAISRKRAWSNLDVILTKSQTPSGFFYGRGQNLKWFNDTYCDNRQEPTLATRRNADAIYFLMRQVKMLGDVPETWKQALERQAEAFVTLWRRYGEFAQIVSYEDGSVLVGGGHAGALACAGLALASDYFGRNEFMQVAEEAAEYYYHDAVERGVSYAGPCEILQAPDSESAFALLEAFVCLWEITGKNRYLQYAERAAKLAATWVVAYDFAFPETSCLGHWQLPSRGAVIANAQNKHGAPGICTLSGMSLFKLYRETGNELYWDLLQEICHNITFFVSRKDRPIYKMPEGWINERINLSDWEARQNVGNGFCGSCWPEVSLLIAASEVPGIYWKPSSGILRCLDHLDVCEVPEGLQIVNPTQFDTDVRIAQETTQGLATRIVHVPAGNTIVINGNI